MMYFVMARHNDARQLIKYFGLKKDMAVCPFPVFLAEDCVLCLSGEGRVNAAAAAAYILTRWGKNGLFVHLGPGKDGAAIYPHTIRDGDITVYQEMLFRPPHFVCDGIIEDGEGVFAYLAAEKWLPLKQIMIVRSEDERILDWLEMLCFGMMSFPISMWKKKRGITL